MNGYNKASYDIVLDYESQVVAQNDGGKVEAKGGKLVFTGVNTLTVFLDQLRHRRAALREQVPGFR